MFSLYSLTRAVSRVVVMYSSPIITRITLILPSLGVSQTHITSAQRGQSYFTPVDIRKRQSAREHFLSRVSIHDCNICEP